MSEIEEYINILISLQFGINLETRTQIQVYRVQTPKIVEYFKICMHIVTDFVDRTIPEPGTEFDSYC